MIEYGWHLSVPDRLRGELDGMLADAVAYDAEAGFSTVGGVADAGPGMVHLIATMPPKGQRGRADLDALPDAEIVAYLRLEGEGDDVAAQLLVRKEFRSLGVATLLSERLRDEPEGWAAQPQLRRVRGWSHGSHPAASRLAARFGAQVERELFRTIRPLRPDDRVGGAEASGDIADGSVDPPTTDPHAVGIAPEHAALLHAPGVRVVRGRGGDVVVRRGDSAEALLQLTPSEDPERLDDLLVLGLRQANAMGARLAVLYVDAREEQLLLHLSRELGFFHDQTDCSYVLALPPAF
ncbi:GNAT family N-acetyltransferase [Nocardioides ultimimeridianus]